MVLGDSLAEGYLAPPEASFPSVLEKRLEIELVNLGQRGATTADSVPRVKEEVLPLEPALVVLELGGNDALQKVDPEVTRANFQTMIDELHGAGVPILLLGVRGGLFKDKFADLYPELAEENGLAYVPDILDGILTSPTLRVDNVHPNAAGHQKIADKVEPELRRLLEQIR